jgi:GT2 family glycosyltransferase
MSTPIEASTVSVLVPTLGRMPALVACIESIRAQSTRPARIVVVLGPDADEAADWLAGQDDLARVRIDQRNLSQARNLGIDRAEGKFVAFLDDDAVASETWLAELIAPLARPEVAAVGGRIVRPDGSDEFHQGWARLTGKLDPVRPGKPAPPGRWWFPTVGGGNCCYRLEALEQVGRFDPFIEFSYDETDLCARLHRAGWRVEHAAPGRIVHHAAAGGHRVDALRRNWQVEIKNQLYFSLKNRRGLASAVGGILRARGRIWKLARRLAAAREDGRIDAAEAREMLQAAKAGFRAGWTAGFRAGRQDPASNSPDSESNSEA